ncbi:MAG: oxidoreductase, partial [Candidatus Methanofastidiosa archaeon]|nr:oxidoreductase [Candidatus Methanofastidiosa archaeon]
SPYTLHRNPFSFSGSSEKPAELRFTIKELGDFSSSIGKLKGGETVYIDGPYGNFSLDDAKTKTGLVLLAGGIGIAPVFSILKSLEDRKDQRPVYLFYGNYDEESIIFYSEIERMKKTLNLKVIHVLEKPQGKITCESGFITRALLEQSLPAEKSGLHFFQCGPLPMIKAIKSYLHQMGIHTGQIHSEEYEMA